MASFKRNIMVGTTVLVALVMLGWMILRFSDAPIRLFAPKQLNITLIAPSAGGISEGSPVTYKGVNVGRVTASRLSRDLQSVEIQAALDREPPLPGNVEGLIRIEQLLGGGAVIHLVLVPPKGSTTRPATDIASAADRPAEPVPVGVLQDKQVLVARYQGFELLPPEFREVAQTLGRTSDSIRLLSDRLRESEIIPNLEKSLWAIKSDAEKAGQTLDHINGIVGDKAIQDNIRLTLANLRETSESARNIGQKLEKLSDKADARLDEIASNGNKLLGATQKQVDDLGRQVNERMTQIAGVLRNLESFTKKLNEGNGTAGQLVNNPALYENLLDTSKELNLMLGDMRRLVEQLEQEGFTFRLGGKK